MLVHNPANMLAMKRKVCVHKAQGNTAKAIEELTNLLKTFQTDVDSWKELVTLYMSEGDMRQATFCQEEVVTCDPRNYQVHNRYADLLYTLGGETNVRSARRHYAQSLELNPQNARAAYGLCLCSYAIGASFAGGKHRGGKGVTRDKSVADDEKELNQKLFAKGLALLRKIYADSPMLKHAESLVKGFESSFGSAGGSALSRKGSSNGGDSNSSSSKQKQSDDAVGMDVD